MPTPPTLANRAAGFSESAPFGPAYEKGLDTGRLELPPVPAPSFELRMREAFAAAALTEPPPPPVPRNEPLDDVDFPPHELEVPLVDDLPPQAELVPDPEVDLVLAFAGLLMLCCCFDVGGAGMEAS